MTDTKRSIRKNKFRQHLKVLIWKSYVQRIRRWRLLIVEALFSGTLFVIAVLLAKPVFLTPLKDQPEPPLTSEDIYASLNRITILGYAPDTEPYFDIMNRAAALLKTTVISGPTYGDLNVYLYDNISKIFKKGSARNIKVIWVLFKSNSSGNVWKFSIRSTDMAVLKIGPPPRFLHLRSGFLAVQLAVSQAIIEYSTDIYPQHDVSLVSMPVTPLMQKDAVLEVISQILLVFTIALLPPVLETEVIVVNETTHNFKRALCMHDVSYSAMYLGWLSYAFMTAVPICSLGSIALLLIFRWLHLSYVMVVLLSYQSIMIMLALIMAMFHDRARIACTWSTLGTLMQTLLAELMVYHGYDNMNTALTFIGHMFIPPLGLVHGFNQFALLQTGKGVDTGHHLYYTTASWLTLVFIYFIVLMLLQRVIGSDKAIGGQVSWKSIIFKQLEDQNKLRPIETPTGSEREKLQSGDELVAKAISFYNVSKNIMGVPILSNVTFDVYRGELSSLFAERSQDKMMVTIEDLIVGLTHADRGTINILGTEMKPGRNVINELFMVGYCYRSKVLIQDLTVEEHIQLYAELSLWNESSDTVTDYIQMRTKHLFRDCHLEDLGQICIKNLGMYYKAQLCWAIAMLLEPRIVVIPHFADDTLYEAVIRDKIKTHKKYLTVLKLSFTIMNLEYADRVFIFDNKLLSFGGTPAYLFFKYGREYRVRLTFKMEEGLNTQKIMQLIAIAEEAGASVRAHLGSLLLLRLPCSPTEKAAALVKTLALNGNKYGVTSMNISLPDSEEVFNRSIARHESDDKIVAQHTKEALTHLSLVSSEKPIRNWFLTMRHIKTIGWKCCTFYVYYRLFIIITVMSTIVAGVFIGIDLSSNLISLDKGSKVISKPYKLTVEAMDHKKTILVIRLDNATSSRSVATAYAISHTNATQKEVDKLSYTAIMYPESLLEYLVTRAIDSPEQYLSLYAYGIDVSAGDVGNLNIQALYSPLHKDTAAAARSLSRVYTSLLRHYTDEPDAAIEVVNEPLTLDQMRWIKHAKDPPLIVTAFLVVTITHILLIPSMEQGYLRHVQSHSYNFSPVRYWASLFLIDLIVYWLLVAVMTGIMYGIIFLNVAPNHFNWKDLLVVPFVLMVYGVGCIPQAYLFSLGPRPALNAMAFILFNIVFGETTIVEKFLYTNWYSYATSFMSLSPQFNIARALLKTKLLFLYNSECLIYKVKNLCTATKIHKCCKKCGLILPCFRKQRFLTKPGILWEVISTINAGAIFAVILLLWNYRYIQRLWTFLISKLYVKVTDYHADETIGVKRHKRAVLAKKRILTKDRHNIHKDSFGDRLLVSNLCKGRDGIYVVRNIFFGLSKGEALAVSGLNRHGRQQLMYLLAGYSISTKGNVWVNEKYNLKKNLHNYIRHVSLCCDLNAVPYWMTVYDALELVAVLRGMTQRDIDIQLPLFIQALELEKKTEVLVLRLLPSELKRLNFAAAVIGAPSVIVLDECTAYQKYSVRRAMYHILNNLKKNGHSIVISSHNVENHMPVTNRLAILRDGHFIDIDQVDQIIARYGNDGYTVVVHLKDEVAYHTIFSKYFQEFRINDTTDVLVNVQILDPVSWDEIFTKMENLLQQHREVIYSYIISATPIDYVYNSMLQEEKGLRAAPDFIKWLPTIQQYFCPENIIYPPIAKIKELQTMDRKYNITQLKELPWSVIFQR